jgi:hypothetical protein
MLQISAKFWLRDSRGFWLRMVRINVKEVRHSAKFSLREAKGNLCGIRFGFLRLKEKL